MSRLQAFRYYVRAGWRRMHPPPAEADWRRACRLADRTPRHRAGRIRLLAYDLAYPDLLMLCPQWHDIFVRETLRFRARTGAPRILDCGANVGLATLFWKRCYPGARITAFEADPAIAAMLRDNLARNGAGDVEVVAKAVWVAGGTVRFVAEGADSGAIAGLSPGIDGPSVAVPAERLRDRLVREPVDLLKLDVEGAELDLLADCAGVLDRVSAIHVEVHDFTPARRLLPAVLELLDRAGFTTALDDLLPITWRPCTAPPSPFARGQACWLTLVRAWRPDPS